MTCPIREVHVYTLTQSMLTTNLIWNALTWLIYDFHLCATVHLQIEHYRCVFELSAPILNTESRKFYIRVFTGWWSCFKKYIKYDSAVYNKHEMINYEPTVIICTDISGTISTYTDWKQDSGNCCTYKIKSNCVKHSLVRNKTPLAL